MFTELQFCISISNETISSVLHHTDTWHSPGLDIVTIVQFYVMLVIQLTTIVNFPLKFTQKSKANSSKLQIEFSQQCNIQLPPAFSDARNRVLSSVTLKCIFGVVVNFNPKVFYAQRFLALTFIKESNAPPLAVSFKLCGRLNQDAPSILVAW